MSDLSKALKSTEKPYTFSFKDSSLDSVAPNSDIFPKQNQVGKLIFLSLALKFSITKQITIIMIVM